MAKRRSPKTTFSLLAAALSLTLLVLLLYFLKLDVLLAWVLAWSVATFGLYGYDKAQSKIGGGRVPKIVLHLSTLAGGMPGAWAGRLLFHHKTNKPRFLIVLLISTLLWGVVGYAYYFLR
ncbi:MAG: hypothetical protein DSY55_04505 [Clostridia bacterium]|nr:MAG: hypothetical protein DSY55_04505 [Clostridia bacterium]